MRLFCSLLVAVRAGGLLVMVLGVWGRRGDGEIGGRDGKGGFYLSTEMDTASSN